MKILRPGNPLKINPKYTGKCRKCDCEVLCEKDEVTTFFDRNESYSHVECPDCGENIYLDLAIGPITCYN